MPWIMCSGSFTSRPSPAKDTATWANNSKRSGGGWGSGVVIRSTQMGDNVPLKNISLVSIPGNNGRSNWRYTSMLKADRQVFVRKKGAFCCQQACKHVVVYTSCILCGYPALNIYQSRFSRVVRVAWGEWRGSYGARR